MKKIKPNSSLFILIFLYAFIINSHKVFAQNEKSIVSFVLRNSSKAALNEKDFNLNLVSTSGASIEPSEFSKNRFSFERNKFDSTSSCETKIIYKSKELVFVFEISAKEILENYEIEIDISAAKRLKDNESVFSYTYSYYHITIYKNGICYSKKSAYFKLY